MTDRPKLISLLSSTKPNDLIVLSVNSLDKNSYKSYQNDMKEKVIQEYLNDLEKVVKQEIKKSELAVIVVKVN